MASVSKTKSGAVRIRFALNGKRKEIYLGKVSQKVSNRFKDHIEALAIASNTSTNVPRRSIEWATGIQDDFKKKLATAGLIDLSTPDDIPTLGNFVDRWIATRTDVKESSRKVYGRARNWLVKFFDEDCSIEDITPGDGDDWRRFMLEHIGGNTACKMSGIAKQVFSYALRKRLIDENPFADLPTAVGARKKTFVEHDTIQKLIDAAPSAEWRLLIVLARYGGLRVPSEPLALKWGDINFNSNTIYVPQPKVEHHGETHRQMPMFHDLKPYLEDVLNEQGGAASPDDDVLQKCRLTNYIPQITRISKQAGVPLTDAFFTCCRSSLETELLEEGMQPQAIHVWLGHSEAVSKKHYRQVRDKHFQDALRLTPKLTPDTSGQEGTEHDNRPTLYRETTKENVGLPTKNGASRIHLKTPFDGPNRTRTCDLHDVNVAL